MISSTTKQNFNSPFREYLGKSNGYYRIRLASKIYLVKSSKKITDAFGWRSVLVIDKQGEKPRLITYEELDIPWIKKNLKAAVNYQKTIEASTSNATRASFGKEQRLMYRSGVGRSWSN